MATVNVLVRARPLSQRERDLNCGVILKMEKYKTFLNYTKIPTDENDKSNKNRSSFTQKQFVYDRSYWSVDKESKDFAGQHHVYSEYGTKVVQSALAGYNTCIFAYGQTGSGKTFTMMGPQHNPGLIPRICQSLFMNLRKMRENDETVAYRVEVSFIEIYNEQVRDLLRTRNQKSNDCKVPTLKIREHPKDGPFVQDLSVHPVSDYSSIEHLMEEGNNLRVTAATSMNDTSSRSHAIFMIKLIQVRFCENMPSETINKVNLVDLAGSERVALSGATGLRLKEGGNINRSLVTLGIIISALAENSIANKGKIPKRHIFVPYRDSALTWLLRDSIGGNSKTIMIATVSPADMHYGETLSTLRYASRARKIVNKPVVNEDPNVKIIRDLRAEIEKLKKILYGNSKIDDIINREMEAKLIENEQRAEQLTRHWIKKHSEAQKIFEAKCMSLSLHGQQTVLKSSKPHLVGLEVDQLSTDIVIYHLEDGRTTIGKNDFSDEQGIALEGSGIEQEHCYLEVQKNLVTLHLISSLVFVNDKIIDTTEKQLHQGDVLQFGHSLKFRFNNPCEAEMLREKRRSGKFSTVDAKGSVMCHYRSLDSGLSSPEAAENEFVDSEGMLNSTTNTSNLSEGNSCNDVLSVKDKRISASSDDFKVNELNQELSEIKPPVVITTKNTEQTSSSTLSLYRRNSEESLNDMKTIKRRTIYKSASTSHIPSGPETTRTSNILSFQYQLAGEIFLSTQNVIISNPIDRTPKSSFGESDMSLEEDDLACNLLLQSQLLDTSTPQIVNNGEMSLRNSFLTLPSSRSQSMNDIPGMRRYSFGETNGSTGQFFPNKKHQDTLDSSDVSCSALAIETKEAAEVFKSKRGRLKTLISNYRQTELERVEIEKENIKRAAENETLFSSQQKHLQNLFKEQKYQLNQSRVELDEFKKNVIEEKEEQRRNVEIELNNLMELKQKHLSFVSGSEIELRKKKFKLKCKIEEYWKRMDLYDNLFIEIELDQHKIRQEFDGKSLERRNRYDTRLSEDIDNLREQIKISTDVVDSLACRIENEKELKCELINDLTSTKQTFENRIEESKNLREQLKEQFDEIVVNKELYLKEIGEQLATEEEKYLKFTIYKLHECVDENCYCDCSVEDTQDCQLTAASQRTIINTLKNKRDEKQRSFDERLQKYSNMLAEAETSIKYLEETALLETQRYVHDIDVKHDLIEALKVQSQDEKNHIRDFTCELQALERPHSYISDFPQEAEEDIISLEQQKEMLIQSKNKVKKLLEDSIRMQFSDMKIGTDVAVDPYTGLPFEYKHIPAIDQALSLIFYSGSNAGYAKGMINKHLQYESRKQLLQDVKEDLNSLLRHQIMVHQEVARNFLSQKSAFEEVRSRDRKDIHDAIQALIGENNSDSEDVLTGVFTVSSDSILEYQDKLENLEYEMYAKIEENQIIQAQLDYLQRRMTEAVTSPNDDFNGDIQTTDPDLKLEIDTLTVEKKNCDRMIQELRKKLEEEKMEYLDMLKNKDEYDVIGQEYRDARHTLFVTEGNQAASEVLTEVFHASNILEASQNNLRCDHNIFDTAWRYCGTERNVHMLRKFNLRKGCLSVIAQGIIKTSPKLVWEAVRNPLSRLMYDKMVKKINIIENCSENLKVVYMQHEARVFLLKRTRDCCCIHAERIENNKYVAAFKSVEHPDCPTDQKYKRSNVCPSGWVIESYTENGEDWSMVWYLVKVDLGKDLPNCYLNTLAQKLPLSIDCLRDYLVLS